MLTNSYLSRSQISRFVRDRLVASYCSKWKIMDWRGFEPLTPRVQGEYSTSLNYQPFSWMAAVLILIVVFNLARILFDLSQIFLWFF